MRIKTNVNLSINSEVIEKAKEMGLNLSKICENALIRSINAFEYANQDMGLNRVNNLSERLVRPPGFGPGSAAWQAAILPG